MPTALRLNVKAVKVPCALLRTKKLTKSDKSLWIRLRVDEFHPRRRSQASRKLAKRTRLARATVISGLRRATSAGWLVAAPDRIRGRKRWKTACPERPGGFVRIPVDLVRDVERVRPREILFYGYLQMLPSFNGLAGEFTWAELCKFTGLDMRTVKRSVRTLAETSWIDITQKDRFAPIRYRLQHADESRMAETARRIEKRLDRSQSVGEAIMHEALSLIVATDKCQEGARPDFLVNPATGEKLELDRYYPNHNVAFEFNGRQHYSPTQRFSRKDVLAQRKRDGLKRHICRRNAIEVIVVQAQDLTITKLLKKVGDLLPRRSLRIFKRTIRHLNQRAKGYQKAAWDAERAREIGNRRDRHRAAPRNLAGNGVKTHSMQ